MPLQERACMGSGLRNNVKHCCARLALYHGVACTVHQRPGHSQPAAGYGPALPDLRSLSGLRGGGYGEGGGGSPRAGGRDGETSTSSELNP